MSDTFDLTQQALLVRLMIGQAGLTQQSRTLTAEAAASHDADPSSVKGIVNKLQPKARAAITQAINQARATFYMNTLPWDDGSYRLCPVTRYAQLRMELDALQNKFYDAVQALTTNYDELREDYYRRVKDLANEVPFPTKSQLESNFRFELHEMPLARPGDIRLQHVDAKAVEAIQNRVSDQMNARLAEAECDLIGRLRALVSRLKEQAEKADGRLFESLVDNIVEAVNLLPSLNITGDPEITRLIARVRTELSASDIPSMRKDERLREQTVKTASEILQDLDAFGLIKPTATKAKATKPTEPTITLEEVIEKVQPVDESATISEALRGFKGL